MLEGEEPWHGDFWAHPGSSHSQPSRSSSLSARDGQLSFAASAKPTNTGRHCAEELCPVGPRATATSSHAVLWGSSQGHPVAWGDDRAREIKGVWSFSWHSPPTPAPISRYWETRKFGRKVKKQPWSHPWWERKATVNILGGLRFGSWVCHLIAVYHWESSLTFKALLSHL